MNIIVQLSLTTNDAGNKPIFPVLRCWPLYQPFSRFLSTNTVSSTFSSSSYSLFGGYGTIHRYRSFRIDLLIAAADAAVLLANTAAAALAFDGGGVTSKLLLDVVGSSMQEASAAGMLDESSDRDFLW